MMKFMSLFWKKNILRSIVMINLIVVIKKKVVNGDKLCLVVYLNKFIVVNIIVVIMKVCMIIIGLVFRK